MKHKLSVIALSIIIAISSSNAFANAQPKPQLEPQPTNPTPPPSTKPTPAPAPAPSKLPTTAPNDPKPANDPKPNSGWDKIKKNIKKIGRPDVVTVAITTIGIAVDYLLDPANNGAKLPAPAPAPAPASEPMCFYTILSGANGVPDGFYNSFEEVFIKMTPPGYKFIEKRNGYSAHPELGASRYYGWYQYPEGSFSSYGDIEKSCNIKQPQPQPQPNPAPEPQPNPAPEPQPQPQPAFELPPFCSWAKVVCDFISDDVDTTPKPPTSPKNLALEPKFNMYINFNGSCPADEQISFNLLGRNITKSFSYQPFCDLLEQISFFLVAFTYLFTSMFIVRNL